MQAERGFILVMGVSGCGKSTVARILSDRLGATFVEGDAYHPPENLAAMAAGIPLTDDMRWGWLDRLAAAVKQAGPGLVVLACSALKRAYRDRLREGTPPMRIVFLTGSYDLLAARMTKRKGHFMPPALLQSQFADLQPPGPDEDALTFDVSAPPEAIAAEAARLIRENHPAKAPEPENQGGDTQ